MTEAAAGRTFWDTYLPPRHRAEAIALAIGLVAVNVLAQYLGRLLVGGLQTPVLDAAAGSARFLDVSDATVVAQAAVVFVAVFALQLLPRMPRSLWLVVAGSVAMAAVVWATSTTAAMLFMPEEVGGAASYALVAMRAVLDILPAFAASLAGLLSALVLRPPAEDPLAALESVQLSEIVPPEQPTMGAPFGERLLPSAFRPLVYGYLTVLGLNGLWRIVVGIPLAVVQSRLSRGMAVPDPAIVSTLTAASFTLGLFLALFFALRFLRVPRAVWLLFAGPTVLSLITVPFAMVVAPAEARAGLLQFTLSGIVLTLVAIAAAMWLGVPKELEEERQAGEGS